MKIPLYLKIILPVTVAACGYAMLTDSIPGEPMAVPSKSVKFKRGPVVEKKQVLSEMTALAPSNLFPYQGPPIILSSVTANIAVSNSTLTPAPELLPAPPFPFHVSGVWNDGVHRKIILTKGDKQNETIIICQHCDTSASRNIGDVIDQQYRLEKIENERITFTYLPLKLEQIVNLDKVFTGTGN